MTFARSGLRSRVPTREFKGYDLTYSRKGELEPGKLLRVTVKTEPG